MNPASMTGCSQPDSSGYEGQRVTVSLRLANFAATGNPEITGTAQVGEALTATTSGIVDADGKTNADNGDAGYAYTYQWVLVDGTTQTDIAGATSNTYTPIGLPTQARRSRSG